MLQLPVVQLERLDALEEGFGLLNAGIDEGHPQLPDGVQLANNDFDERHEEQEEEDAENGGGADHPEEEDGDDEELKRA